MVRNIEKEGRISDQATDSFTCTSAEGKSDYKGIESSKYRYNSHYLCSITNYLHLAVVQGHVACNGEELRLQKLLPLCLAPGCLARGGDPLPSSPCNLVVHTQHAVSGMLDGTLSLKWMS